MELRVLGADRHILRRTQRLRRQPSKRSAARWAARAGPGARALLVLDAAGRVVKRYRVRFPGGGGALRIERLHYGSQGFDDHNWGCCYRAGQMLIGALSAEIPSVPEMMRVCGTWPEGVEQDEELEVDNTRSLWIEPADVARCARQRVSEKDWEVCQWIFGAARGRMMRQPQIPYAEVTPEDLRRHLRETGVPVVVDNGISAYLLTRVDDDDRHHYLDPHKTRDEDMDCSWRSSKAFLDHFPLCMMATARRRRG